MNNAAAKTGKRVKDAKNKAQGWAAAAIKENELWKNMSFLTDKD